MKIMFKPAERSKVKKILNKGKESDRVIRRVQVLDMIDKGYTQ